MRASVIMAIAAGMYVMTRWERDEPAITLDGVMGALFVILVIAMLDQGKTEPIARGFAWIFFITAAYNALPAFTNALSSAQKSAAAAAKSNTPKG